MSRNLKDSKKDARNFRASQTVDKVPKGALFFVAKKDEKEVGIWYN